jgi:hypothetical protein
MVRKIGHTKASFRGAIFAKGRGGKYWGWASNGRAKAIVELGEAVWAAENGPIPSGSKLVYLDGDFENCELENLGLTGGEAKPAAKKPAKKAKAKKASK